MKTLRIEELYDHKRFNKSTYFHNLLLAIYFPFGILIMILRILVKSIVLLLSKLIKSRKNKRLLDLLLIKTLGIKVCFNNISNFDFNVNSIIVANHVLLGDFLPFLLMKHEIIVLSNDKSNPFWEIFESIVRRIVMRPGLSGFKECNIQVNNTLDHSKDPVSILMYPEETIGNGKALHKFKKYAFTFNAEIQPVFMALSHPFAINLHPINSSHIMNILYSYFVPILVYHIDFMPKQKRYLNETPEDFAERVQLLIADSAEILPSYFTVTDKRNYKNSLWKKTY